MKNVILLTGPENYLIDAYVTKVRKTITNDFNLSLFEGLTNEQDIINSCYQVPFMGDNRFVIVNCDISKGDCKDIEKYCKNYVDSTILILVSPEIDMRKSFYKTLEKFGEILSFNKLREKELVEFLKKYLSSKGATTQTDIIPCIIEKTAYLIVEDSTLMELVSEVDKLLNYAGKSVITKEMVDKIVKPFVNTNVFRLIAHVSKRETNKALSYLEGLLDSGVSEMHLLSLLLRHYRILFKLKHFDSAQIGISSFMMNEFPDLKDLKSDQILKCMETVVTTQNDIKNGSVGSRLGMEVVLVRLTICAAEGA